MKTTQSKRDLKYKIRLLFAALPETRTNYFFLKKRKEKRLATACCSQTPFGNGQQKFVFKGYLIIQSPSQSTVQAK